MKKDYTDITVILDRSGSMANIAKDMEGGFNQFVEDQKTLPGTCKLSLIQFDTEAVEPVYEGRTLDSVPPLALQPRGGTPLWDAFGHGITKTGERLKSLPDAERPDKVLVMVITDGQENSSKEWNASKVKSLVKSQQDKYKWSFQFLAANLDAFGVGGQAGVGVGSSTSYACTPLGVQSAFAAVSATATAYRSTGALPDFTEKQRSDMSRS